MRIVARRAVGAVRWAMLLPGAAVCAWLILGACGDDDKQSSVAGRPDAAPDAGSDSDASDARPCRATQVGAGASHACALRSDGSVACWGHFLTVGFCAASGVGAPELVDELS